jgi:PST family polysaccharide transporter
LGQTARQLRQQLVVTPLTVLGFLLGLPWGALGVAVSFSVTRALLSWPSLAWCYRGTPIRMRQTAITLARPAAASIAAGAVLWALHATRAQWPNYWVVLDALLYGAAYLAAWFVMPGGRANLREQVQIVRELRASKR